VADMGQLTYGNLLL